MQQYLDIFCSTNIDDVIIYSDGNIDDHYEKVKKVLNSPNTTRLHPDLEKCTSGAREVKYFGFIIEAGNGIKVDPDKVEAKTKWEELESVSAVQSFLRFANFFREFIHNFSAICEPLNKLTGNGVAWA